MVVKNTCHKLAIFLVKGGCLKNALFRGKIGLMNLL